MLRAASLVAALLLAGCATGGAMPESDLVIVPPPAFIRLQVIRAINRQVNAEPHVDCNDYAFTKQDRLRAVGISSRLAAATVPWGDGHMVLTVDLGGETWVLDNLATDVRPWRDVPYQWWGREDRAGLLWHAIGEGNG